MEKNGDALLCIRYRYDELRGVRLKTVEIILEEKPCTPSLRYRDTDIVAIMLPYPEKPLYLMRDLDSMWGCLATTDIETTGEEEEK